MTSRPTPTWDEVMYERSSSWAWRAGIAWILVSIVIIVVTWYVVTKGSDSKANEINSSSSGGSLAHASVTSQHSNGSLAPTSVTTDQPLSQGSQSLGNVRSTLDTQALTLRMLDRRTKELDKVVAKNTAVFEVVDGLQQLQPDVHEGGLVVFPDGPSEKILQMPNEPATIGTRYRILSLGDTPLTCTIIQNVDNTSGTYTGRGRFIVSPDVDVENVDPMFAESMFQVVGNGAYIEIVAVSDETYVVVMTNVPILWGAPGIASINLNKFKVNFRSA